MEVWGCWTTGGGLEKFNLEGMRTSDGVDTAGPNCRSSGTEEGTTGVVTTCSAALAGNATYSIRFLVAGSYSSSKK